MLAEPGLAVVVRWATFIAILLAVGAAACRVTILRRSGECRRAAGIGLGAALALVLLAGVRLAAQASELRDPGDPWSEAVAIVLGTTWGTGWWLQLGAALAAAAGFAAAQRDLGPGWAGAALAALVLAATPALSGHAVGSERLTGLAVAADTLHVLAGGVWLGSLAILTATLPASPATAAAAVRAFSPVALAAAGIVVASGGFASWLHLGAVDALWRTGYGRMLVVKLALFALVAAVGAYNWRRMLPRLDAPDGLGRLRGSARAELAVALLVLLATAVLVATPLPGEE